MGLRVSEASAFDLLEALGDDGRAARLTRRRFGEMARQVAEGAAWTIRDPGGALVAVVGLWPEADHFEAWLAAGPGMRARALAGLRLARRLLEAVAGAAGGGEVRCYVREAGRPDGSGGRVAGARMAAGLGFSRIGQEADALGPVSVFARHVAPEE